MMKERDCDSDKSIIYVVICDTDISQRLTNSIIEYFKANHMEIEHKHKLIIISKNNWRHVFIFADINSKVKHKWKEMQCVPSDSM